MAEILRAWPALDLVAVVPCVDDLDDRVALALDDVGAIAVEHDTDRRWRVYFSTDGDRNRAAGLLCERLGHGFALTSLDVPDEGWATKVQSVLCSVEVGSLIVCPPWDLPAAPAPGSRVVVIEPSTGFGTGHHQSTRLCLRALQRLDLAGRRVVDVGTGSGVLAITACLLGADDVLAIDNDADAVTSARENAARNGVSGDVAFAVADLDTIGVHPGDVVLANLTALLLRRLARPLAALVAPGGLLVTSGFTFDQVTLVTDAFPEFDVVGREDEDDWVGLTFRRAR